MRKPVYYAYVARESHPDSQGEKYLWTKVGVAFPTTVNRSEYCPDGIAVSGKLVLLEPWRKIIHHRIRAPSKPCRNHLNLFPQHAVSADPACHLFTEVTMLSTTAFLAIAMQCAASIHPSTAFDVARVEPNPYAIADCPEGRPLFRRSTHYFSPASQPGDAEHILRRLSARIAVTLSG